MQQGFSDEDWVKLRKTIADGVARGVLLAGVFLLVVGFACGLFLSPGMGR